MKKILSILMIFVLFLSACSSDDSSSDGDVTEITLWTNGTQYFEGEEKVDEDGNTYRDESTASFQLAADAFEEETGIHVNFETIQAGAEQVDNLVKNGDPSVDIYAAPQTVTDEDVVAYYDPAFDSVEECSEVYTTTACELAIQSDGKVYGQVHSVAYDPMIIYNKGVVEAAGYDEIPTEIDDFYVMLDAIKANGVTPIGVHRIENWPLLGFDNVASYAGNDGEQLAQMLTYDEPFAEDNPFGQAADYMNTIVSEGYTESETYADFGVLMDSVAYGDTAMVMFGSWIIPQIESRVLEGDDVEIAVAPFPKLEGDDTLNVGVTPEIPFYIPSGSDAKEEAQQFIDYLAHDQFTQDSYGGTPSVVDMTGLEDSSSEQMQYMADLVASGEVEEIPIPYYSPNKLTSQEVLKDMGVFADYKYWGNSFDIAGNEGYDAAMEEFESMNSDWQDAVEAGGYTYQE